VTGLPARAPVSSAGVNAPCSVSHSATAASPSRCSRARLNQRARSSVAPADLLPRFVAKSALTFVTADLAVSVIHAVWLHPYSVDGKRDGFADNCVRCIRPDATAAYISRSWSVNALGMPATTIPRFACSSVTLPLNTVPLGHTPTVHILGNGRWLLRGRTLDELAQEISRLCDQVVQGGTRDERRGGDGTGHGLSAKPPRPSVPLQGWTKGASVAWHRN
jgi:hypothetical protein